MQGYSTLTQKGQVAIPKSIRDYFALKPFAKIRFTIEDNKIIAQPLLTITDMFGFVKTTKKVSKEEMKKTIKKQVLKKYANRT